jgi:hypothetical protein
LLAHVLAQVQVLLARLFGCACPGAGTTRPFARMSHIRLGGRLRSPAKARGLCPDQAGTRPSPTSWPGTSRPYGGSILRPPEVQVLSPREGEQRVPRRPEHCSGSGRSCSDQSSGSVLGRRPGLAAEPSDHAAADLRGRADPHRAGRRVWRHMAVVDAERTEVVVAGAGGLLFFAPLLLILFRRKYPGGASTGTGSCSGLATGWASISP